MYYKYATENFTHSVVYYSRTTFALQIRYTNFILAPTIYDWVGNYSRLDRYGWLHKLSLKMYD